MSTPDAASALRQRMSQPTWLVEEFIVETCESLKDDTPVLLNLAKTLVEKKIRRSKGKANNERRHWLPKVCCDSEEKCRTNQVFPIFSRAAIKAGFALRNKGWYSDRCR